MDDSQKKRVEKAALFLLPNALGDSEESWQALPACLPSVVMGLVGLLAESEKSGRRFLKRFAGDRKIHDIPIALLNEHTPLNDIDFLLDPIAAGQSWGLISDAGIPCVADPGDRLVGRARERRIPVKAVGGGSSILLSLMLSGLPGQRFAFHGYLARTAEERKHQITALERDSKRLKSTQILMEAPYRNQQMLEVLLACLDDKTWLCVVADLTLASEEVISKQVARWKGTPMPALNKRPCQFLIYAP